MIRRPMKRMTGLRQVWSSRSKRRCYLKPGLMGNVSIIGPTIDRTPICQALGTSLASRHRRTLCKRKCMRSCPAGVLQSGAGRGGIHVVTDPRAFVSITVLAGEIRTLAAPRLVWS